MRLKDIQKEHFLRILNLAANNRSFDHSFVLKYTHRSTDFWSEVLTVRLTAIRLTMISSSNLLGRSKDLQSEGLTILLNRLLYLLQGQRIFEQNFPTGVAISSQTCQRPLGHRELLEGDF